MKERFETFTVLINRISRNIRKIKTWDGSIQPEKRSHLLPVLFLSDPRLTEADLCERCE